MLTGSGHSPPRSAPGPNILPRSNRNDPICFIRYLYRARNLVERFFNKIKQCRRVATRYDKLAANYLAFIQLASIRCGCALMSPRPNRRTYGILFEIEALTIHVRIDYCGRNKALVNKVPSQREVVRAHRMAGRSGQLQRPQAETAEFQNQTT